jgi:hypothetical protein
VTLLQPGDINVSDQALLEVDRGDVVMKPEPNELWEV